MEGADANGRRTKKPKTTKKTITQPVRTQETSGTTVRKFWDLDSEHLLLSWLEEEGVYDSLRGATVTAGPDGKKRGNGKSKTAVCREGVDYFKRNGITTWDSEAVRQKIKSLEGSWRKGRDFLNNTGAGITEEEKLQTPDIVGKLHSMCQHFDRLDPLMRDRPSSDVTLASGSLSGCEISEDILLGLRGNSDNDGEAEIPLEDEQDGYVGLNPERRDEIREAGFGVPQETFDAEDATNASRGAAAEGDEETCKTASVLQSPTPLGPKTKRLFGPAKEATVPPKSNVTVPEAIVTMAEMREKASVRDHEYRILQLGIQREELELKRTDTETKSNEAKARLVAEENRQLELKIKLAEMRQSDAYFDRN